MGARGPRAVFRDTKTARTTIEEITANRRAVGTRTEHFGERDDWGREA
jgi:hypothetical protein